MARAHPDHRRKPDGRGERGKRRSAPRDERQSRGRQIEGIRAVEHALRAHRRKITKVILVNHEAGAASSIPVLAERANVRIEAVSNQELARRAVTAVPQGVIALAEPLPESTLADSARRAIESDGFLVVSDGVVDPGNLGAIMRTAEAMGATGVLLPERGGAPLSPTVLKAAAGAAEYLDFTYVSSVAKAIAALKNRGIWSIGLDSSGDPIYGSDLLSEPIALIVGAEGRGLSKLVRERCDLIASIPARGAVESLNASAAVAAACSEILRIRLSRS